MAKIDQIVKFITEQLLKGSAVSVRLTLPQGARDDLTKLGIKFEPEIYGYWRFSRHKMPALTATPEGALTG